MTTHQDPTVTDEERDELAWTICKAYWPHCKPDFVNKHSRQANWRLFTNTADALFAAGYRKSSPPQTPEA